ncbi:hypothetical protein [Pandoraea nosoerga]|uniref:hypothetical protein n=1 Tax=Pandoraea nosoerga TaxID=2508296 RepID=UPI002402D27C|nr:hypothetical protein [Pandoraea nosoerga]
MRRPDETRIAHALARTLDSRRGACEAWQRESAQPARYGRIDKITPNAMRARLPGAALGEQCRVLSPALDAEVIAVEGRHVWLAPYAQPNGVASGTLVQALGTASRVAVGPHLVGRVLDGLGRPLASGTTGGEHARDTVAATPDAAWRALDAPPPRRRWYAHPSPRHCPSACAPSTACSPAAEGSVWASSRRRAAARAPCSR